VSRHKTFGGEIVVDDGEDEYRADPSLEAYADLLDAMTHEELVEHQRTLNAVGQFEEMEREGLI
jgi:hypothetical protein